MTLSAEEYHDHLKTTAVRAGFSFDEVVLPEQHRVTVNGLGFRYLDWGTQGRRPVLFLHGGALTAHTWDLCCLALRDAYHCMALDQRGHGDSDWAPDANYSISAQREDVKGFAEAVGLDQFVLVGMSLGAINGLAYAIAYPEALSALVLIDAGPNVRRPGSRRIRDFVNGGAEPETLEAIIERAMLFNPRRDPLVLRRRISGSRRGLNDIARSMIASSVSGSAPPFTKSRIRREPGRRTLGPASISTSADRVSGLAIA